MREPIEKYDRVSINSEYIKKSKKIENRIDLANLKYKDRAVRLQYLPTIDQQ